MFIIEVKHMVPLKQHMSQHLRCAKDWLTKAEEAFAKQHDLRGELDLMLAQAELQHVKEVNRSRQWRYKYVIYRHGVALVLAMFVVVVLSGVYWWTARPNVVLPIPIVQQANLPAPIVLPEIISVTPSSVVRENKLSEPETATPVAVIEPNKVQGTDYLEQGPKLVQPPKQSEEPAALSADEMRKLVRAAGKSLRGQ